MLHDHQDFSNAAQNGPLAGIQTMTNDIANDVLHDPAVKDATQAWSACMTRTATASRSRECVRPGAAGHARRCSGSINASATPVSASARQAQIAAAVTDADCTQSSDLAGIYFAVQASYEQQLVNANQQALTDGGQAVPRRLRQGTGQAPGAAADGEGPAVSPAGTHAPRLDAG